MDLFISQIGNSAAHPLSKTVFEIHKAEESAVVPYPSAKEITKNKKQAYIALIVFILF